VVATYRVEFSSCGLWYSGASSLVGVSKALFPFLLYIHEIMNAFRGFFIVVVGHFMHGLNLAINKKTPFSCLLLFVIASLKVGRMSV
jgi:hypothetical protein